MVTTPRVAESSRISYLICTLPRSGSWLLCDALTQTGVAGVPNEFFEPASFKHAPGTRAARERLDEIRREGMTDNGVFGAKVHWHQFRLAERLLRAENPRLPSGTAKLFDAAFPNLQYVWLTRHNKVEQAISYYRAIHTQVWWRTRRGHQPKARDPEFSFAAIDALERQLGRWESNWQRYFDANAIDPVVLTYEDMQSALHAHVELVLGHLGIAGATRRVSTKLVAQRDHITSSWTARYSMLKEARERRLYSFIMNVSAFDPPVSSAGAGPAVLCASGRVRASAGNAINGVEIRIAAPQRSGHHAVVNWLAAQLRGSVLYLNDAVPGSNPFFTATIASRLDLPGAPSLDRSKLDVFAKRGSLIVSYEDRDPDAVFDAAADRHHDAWVGPSDKVYDVVVLRDVFNTFASRLRAPWMRHKLDDEAGRAATIRLWKTYARRAVQAERNPDQRLVFVNFNRWFSDESYRKRVAASLGLPFSDAGRDVVDGRYGGSSFDGTAFRSTGSRMRVLDRWSEFADSAAFWALFQDEELVALSNQIFGTIVAPHLLGHSRAAPAAGATQEGR